jgi:ribosome-associated protein
MNIVIPPDAVREDFVRASGPGGQNVNKVSTAVHLRVETSKLNLTDEVRARLSRLAGKKLTAEGTLILKLQQFRTQERNRSAAWAQLEELLARAQEKPTPRKATKPSRAAKEKRLTEKKQRSETKSLRRQTEM